MYKISTKKTGRLSSLTIKFLRIMKLTIILLMTSLCQVSAAVFAQRVNIKNDKISLSSVFKEINKQTGYHVLWQPNLLNDKSIISVNFKNSTIEEVMEKCLGSKDISYVIEDKTIILHPKEKSFFSNLITLFNKIDIQAKIVDEQGLPLPGASVKVIKTGRTILSNNNGFFEIKSIDEDAELTISFIGFESRSLLAKNISGNIVLKTKKGELQEVGIVAVSDGYRKISRERATGSYEFLDSAIINRGVSPSILDRIENMAPGILTLRNRSSAIANEPLFSIRGRSTIYSNVEPLVVVDNYPFEGDINSINPNDVESITILKDAAATSIWGARGGNGVLVITMKQGKLNQATQVSFNSSFTTAQKTDLYSVPQLSSSEFIEVQQFLYDKGYYGFANPAPGDIVSPAVRILHQKRNNLISADEAEKQLSELRKQDVRKDLAKYTLDNVFNQQHALNISGGGTQNRYFLSAGYNRGSGSNGSINDRKSLTFSDSYSFLNNRLQLTAKIIYSDSKNEATNYSVPTDAVFPYSRLADDNGNHLELPYKYTKAQINGLAGGTLLDMTYIPLDEFNYGRNKSHIQDYSINTELSYKIIEPLQVMLSYQYGSGKTEGNNIYDVESFQARETINRFTTYTSATGVAVRNVPYGGSTEIRLSSYENHNFRGQLAYNKNFGADHQISALAGTEVRSTNRVGSTRQEYGYNKEFDSYQRYNANTNYPSIFNGGMSSIYNLFSNSNIASRFFSVFANASYTYKNRYIISASARKDESNLFGVDANKRGVPLWSTGLAWIINNESFYNVNWLPQLKLRATNGYSGNTGTGVSSQTITALGGGTNFGLGQFYNIQNPPNPELRWEKIQQLNLGLDFGFKKGIVSGSIEFFRKNATDLISSQPVAPQVGVVNFRGNFADVKTTGFDLTLNAKPLSIGGFNWTTTLITSRAVDVITKFDVKQDPRSSVLNNSQIPRVGYSYSALFTYRYAGLNALGQPMVYSNGVPTTDLATIVNSANPNDIIYVGNNNAKVAGSFRNDFSYKNVSLSFNIAYRFGHYFKRTALNYQSLFSGNYKQPDYANRWQKPGDELHTNVPAMTYPVNNISQVAFDSSDAIVEKASSIRLQDIQLSYNFSKANFKKLPFKNIQLYGYAYNLGILWKATDLDTDPDFPGQPRNSKQFSFGLRASL